MNTDEIGESIKAEGVEYVHQELTKDILASSFRVHNALGCGLLEKVYTNALVWDLQLNNREVSAQQEFKVAYREKEIGSYFRDLVVDDNVIVEVKAVERIDNIHRAQLLNYLRISVLRVGLLINFANPRLEYERLVV